MGIHFKHVVIDIDLVPEKIKKYREKRDKKKVKKKVIVLENIEKALKKFKCPKNKRIKPKGKTCLKCDYYKTKGKKFCGYKKG